MGDNEVRLAFSTDGIGFIIKNEKAHEFKKSPDTFSLEIDGTIYFLRGNQLFSTKSPESSESPSSQSAFAEVVKKSLEKSLSPTSCLANATEPNAKTKVKDKVKAKVKKAKVKKAKSEKKQQPATFIMPTFVSEEEFKKQVDLFWENYYEYIKEFKENEYGRDTEIVYAAMLQFSIQLHDKKVVPKVVGYFNSSNSKNPNFVVFRLLNMDTEEVLLKSEISHLLKSEKFSFSQGFAKIYKCSFCKAGKCIPDKCLERG